MAERDALSTLPPALRQVLDADRRVGSRRAAQDLPPAAVTRLKDVLSRPGEFPAGARLSRAIEVLAVRDPSAETATILAGLAGDERIPRVDRAVAAASLRLVARPEAREGLEALLDTSDPAVRREAVRSLGCIGDEGSLRALRRAGPRSGEPERSLVFARSLIAHRLGQPSDDLPFREGVARRPGDPDRLIELSLRPVRPATTRAALRRMTGPAYGIDLSERVGFALRAGRADWNVLVNADVVAGRVPFAATTRIFERPWITALVARVEPQQGVSAVQYVVLSDPEPGEDAARVMVVRADGELVYSGRLGRSRGLLSFVVRDIDRRGTAPTHVRGHLTARGVEFDVKIPFGQRKAVRPGEAVVPPR